LSCTKVGLAKTLSGNPNYDEKINRLINNRNLKDYSCFIGVKTAEGTLFNANS
jgi:hypothetical protein